MKQSIEEGIYSTNHVLRHQVQHRFTLPIVSQRSNLIKNYHAVNIQGAGVYLLFEGTILMSHKLAWNLLLIVHMRNKNKIQAIIRMLITSKFYFDLSPRERYDLIRDILKKFPTSIRSATSLGEKDLFFKR